MQEHAISVKDISFQHSLIFLLKTVDQFINPASPGASASLCSYVMPIVKSSYRSQYDLVIFFFPSWKSILLHQTGSHHIDHGGCFVSMFTTSFRRFPIIWRASRLSSRTTFVLPGCSTWLICRWHTAVPPRPAVPYLTYASCRVPRSLI